MASFIFQNVWQSDKKVPCELTRGAGRQIIVHPEKDGGPCVVMHLFKGDADTSNIENALLKNIDKDRYFNTYHKYVKTEGGFYLHGYYTLYLSDVVYEEFMSIPEFAALPLEPDVTEEDFQDAASPKRVHSDGGFLIICCKDQEEADAKVATAFHRI